MIIPAGHAQVNLVFTGTALPNGAEMTFGVDIGTIVGAISDLPQDIADLWGTSNMRALMTNETALTEVRVKVGPNDIGPTYEASPAIQGTDAGTAVPPNAAVLITKVTAAGGRAGRGRLYLPAVDKAEVDDAGNLTGPMVAAVNTNADAFLDGLTALGTPMEVFHGATSPLFSSGPTNVTALVCQNRIATQRRRLRP